MAYESKFIEDVKASANADPETIIGHYIKLQRQGKTLMACCPFHDEKTPSFSVYTGSKPGYHCYGSCDPKDGGSGDSIGFIMKHQKVDFIGAIKEAASILGMPEQFAPAAQKTEEELKHAQLLGKMRVALAETSTLYANELAKSEEGLMYLLGRGFTPHDIQAFGIGFAPKKINFIYSQLKSKFDDSVLLGSSIIGLDRKSKQPIDFQYYRIIFPIRDYRSGDVIGFGGRALQLTRPNPENPQEPIKIPKYKNSAETELFKKSEVLYGFYEALKAPPPKHPRRWLVTEGYTDVIAAHRHRYTHTVASMGTAFNQRLAKLLFLNGDQIIFGQDGDKAGIEAIYRAIRETAPLLTPEKTCGILLMPTGEDIDSLLTKNPAKFAALYDNPMSVSEFISDYVVKKYPSTPEGRAAAINHVEELINTMTHEALRLSMRQAIYDRTGITIANGAVPKALSPKQQQEAAFTKLDLRGQSMVSQMSESVKSVSGMLIKHPRWASFISLSAIENNPAFNKVERGALMFSVRAGGDEKSKSNPLCQYLMSHAPSEIDEQLQLAARINDNQAMLIDWDDDPTVDQDRPSSSFTMSN